MKFALLISCLAVQCLFASPKLVGTWQLASNPSLKLYLEKDNQAFLSSGDELSWGTWAWNEQESRLSLQWQNNNEEWQVSEIKNNEWSASVKGETFLWKKAEGLKIRDSRLFQRRMLGVWTTTDSLYQGKWVLIFRKKNCTEKTATGLQRNMQWDLSEDARFLEISDKEGNTMMEIIELKDFSMQLGMQGGQVLFERELLYSTAKSLEVYITEQKLIGEWLLLNPTEEVKEFKMVFKRDGIVHSYTDGEEISESWKLSKRGKRLTIYSIEEETRYELDLKFSRKNKTIELKEPESSMKLNRVE